MEKTNLEIAKELGIDNPESLSAAQLKKAIAVANEKKQSFELLKERAKELGVIFSEDVTFEDLTKDVEASEQAIEDLKISELFNKKAHLLIDSTVGLDRFESLSLEELLDAVNEIELFNRKVGILIDAVIGIEQFKILSAEELIEFCQKKSAVEEVDELAVASGKTEETISSKGIVYQFSEKAPESFKFMGIVQTQKEWIKDSDAMELMISGNLSYVKPLKK